MPDMISVRLARRVMAAMGGQEKTGFRGKLFICNPDKEYKHTFLTVTSVNIVQDFLHNYMDQILVSVQMTPAEYQDVYANSTNLEATLILTPYNLVTNSPATEQEPIILETRVMVDKLVDIDKVINPNLVSRAEDGAAKEPHQKDMRTTIDFHLVEKECYDLRRVRLNATFTECDVESVIHWAGANFGAEKCSVTPPDNKQVYTNLIVDPFKDISDIFPFLQARYGIYSKGLGYYFTNKTLYVYPAYDHEVGSSTVTNTCNIIGVNQDKFAGNHVYHTRVEDDIWIMCLKNTITNVSQSASENVGNVTMTLNPETSMHNAAILGGDGKLTRDNSDITVVQSQNTATNTSEKMLNTNYVVGSSNIFVATSKMAEGDAVILNSVWDTAIPRAIAPGMHCVYNYDAAGGDFKTQNGRVLSVEYKSFPMRNSFDKYNPMMKFVANVMVHLAPDQQAEPQSQFK